MERKKSIGGEIMNEKRITMVADEKTKVMEKTS